MFWTVRENYLPKELPRSMEECYLTTDASKMGWGAELKIDGRVDFAQGDWSLDPLPHVNILELEAVHLGLGHFSSLLRDRKVLISSDNKTTVATLRKMGSCRCPVHQDIMQKIALILSQGRMDYQVCFIPGKENIIADNLSRCHSRGTSGSHIMNPELMLSSNNFCLIMDELNLVPEVDLFASSRNHHLPVYVSAENDTRVFAVNAFSI